MLVTLSDSIVIEVLDSRNRLNSCRKMGKDAVPEVGLLDTDNWWEWAVRMEDLLI
jgi:hypothetical protein